MSTGSESFGPISRAAGNLQNAVLSKLVSNERPKLGEIALPLRFGVNALIFPGALSIVGYNVGVHLLPNVKDEPRQWPA